MILDDALILREQGAAGELTALIKNGAQVETLV